MKKVLIAAVLAMILAPAHAGLFSSAVTSGWPEVEPLNKYKLEVYGFDMRVYEFRMVSNPTILCVATFSGGDTNAYQLECIKDQPNPPQEP
jgi:hypothetical protein